MPESLPTITLAITLNGARRTLAPGTTVSELVAETTGLTATARGIAVAVNSRVVPRSLWDGTTLGADDEVEVVSAAQGG